MVSVRYLVCKHTYKGAVILIFFTSWGISTYPWQPKGPRIWKLAKKYSTSSKACEIFWQKPENAFVGMISKFNFRCLVWQIFTFRGPDSGSGMGNGALHVLDWLITRIWKWARKKPILWQKINLFRYGKQGLKVPSGQIGSAWEWYHWIGLKKNINRYRFTVLFFYFWSWIFDKSSKFWTASCKNESILLLVWITVEIFPPYTFILSNLLGLKPNKAICSLAQQK
jgi:hypothetical protein